MNGKTHSGQQAEFNDPDGGAAFAALKQAAEAVGYTVVLPEYPYSGFMAPVDSIRSFRFTYSYTSLNA